MPRACTLQREATAMGSLHTEMKSSSRLLQLDKACAKAMKTWCSQKKKKVNTIQSNLQIQCNPYQISNVFTNFIYLVYLFIFGCAMWMKPVPPATEVWSPKH